MVVRDTILLPIVPILTYGSATWTLTKTLAMSGGGRLHHRQEDNRHRFQRGRRRIRTQKYGGGQGHRQPQDTGARPSPRRADALGGARGSACLAANCALEAAADGGRARRGKPRKSWMEQIDEVALAVDCEDWQVAGHDRDEWKQICLQARELPEPWTVHNAARKQRTLRRATGQEEQGVDAGGEMDPDDPPPL